ncbi:amidase [Opitutus sp. GAS368]|jgi:amidase|uniref:amidase n=1 Tax=Opitutus sp. GAS368 TaxID=1882749 RepID=UPI00087D5A45|nr:amidase [Opitutus sp. GAS368]SDS20169.1 amidase [Opitutus sp. GAS368]
MKTRLLLLGLVLTTARAAFPFAEATIEQLQQQMAAGRLTSRELTAAYLQRIAEVDRAGPRLNAVIELNPDALAIADQLDVERKAGHVRGPLHGIPVLLKDNIDTADRMQTTAGSLALVGQKVPRDAGVAARLRAAGAVILGKTNCTEWANYRGNNSSSGWSGRGGQTCNPYALDRNPSGSSSGSGAAVSANLCVFAIGTETNGSIVSPASACGIVGLKPTVGLISRDGIIPIAASQDTAGPMTRTVRDAALVLAAIAGADEHDPATSGIPAGLAAELAAPLKPGALRGARIGIVRGPFGFHARMEPALAALIAALQAAGAEVVDPVKVGSLGNFGSATGDLLSYEFKDGLNRYLATPGRVTPMKALADLIAFNEAHRSEEMAWFGQEDFTAAQARGPLTDQAYLDAKATCLRLARTEGLDAALDGDKLDALVMFTRGVATLTDPLNGEGGSGSSSTLAAVAGYPNLTVPAAQFFGLPVGLSFVGRPWSEAKLLALAADFETVTKARREPTFLPTVTVR